MSKSNYLLCVVLSVLGATQAHGATAPAGESVSLPIQSVLMPFEGFDDNDTVQMVVHGNLPSACYQLGEAKFELKAGRVIEVSQAASHLSDGLCDEEEILPDYMRMPIPFTSELTLGHLEAGEYRIEFKGGLGIRQVRTLKIGHSDVPTLDERFYASVTQVVAPDVIHSGQDLKVTLIGLYNSDCVGLDSELGVIVEQEVSIVLPYLAANADAECHRELRPFSREVNLGKVTGSHHLIHVRSMNGRGLNHWVEVLP